MTSGLPPYLDILLQHTRLSIYGAVVNHVTATLEISRHLCSSGLASALNVMRAAVQGEQRLKSMPNNTAVMVSFAVCFVLELLSDPNAIPPSLIPGAKGLVRQTIEVLIRIGTTPEHREGVSALYGCHLQRALARFNVNVQPSRPPSRGDNARLDMYAARLPLSGADHTIAPTPTALTAATPTSFAPLASLHQDPVPATDDFCWFPNMDESAIVDAVSSTDPLFDLGIFSGVDWTSISHFQH